VWSKQCLNRSRSYWWTIIAWCDRASARSSRRSLICWSGIGICQVHASSSCSSLLPAPLSSAAVVEPLEECRCCFPTATGIEGEIHSGEAPATSGAR
jgi:hypothetical protein